MTKVVRRVPLLVTHLALLPAGALLVWWWASPVQSSGWASQLPSFSWPSMALLALAPGAVAGVMEARLLRWRPAAGVMFVLAASVVGLWLPLLYVSHSTADVVPVETGDVVASVLLWGLFWVATTTTSYASLGRAGLVRS